MRGKKDAFARLGRDACTCVLAEHERDSRLGHASAFRDVVTRDPFGAGLLHRRESRELSGQPPDTSGARKFSISRQTTAAFFPNTIVR